MQIYGVKAEIGKWRYAYIALLKFQLEFCATLEESESATIARWDRRVLPLTKAECKLVKTKI